LASPAADPDRTRAAAAALGVARVFDSSEALVVDPGVDVIHICTPNHLHADLARRALVAGKHVVCEKPLATSAADATALVDLAERAGLSRRSRSSTASTPSCARPARGSPPARPARST